MNNLLRKEIKIPEEVIRGLTSEQKQIPSKYFYDKKGSELFAKICELDEYYPTRTETKILAENVSEISKFFSPNSVLVEFGSGSSIKTRILLKQIKKLLGYVPIDISENYLIETVSVLKNEFPHLVIKPLAADYNKKLIFPKFLSDSEQKVVFFPGSTIGNFTKEESRDFLSKIRTELKKGDGFILGIDLIKDKNVLEAAYDDLKGITAEFNLNILSHLNKLYNTDFKLSNFIHKATYNENENRIEMYLISTKNQIVSLGNNKITIDEGEMILTEYSHKYSIEILNDLCKDLFHISSIWKDKLNYFAVCFLSPV